jgi:hypothetical protein
MEDKKQKDEKTEEKKKNNGKIKYFSLCFVNIPPFYLRPLIKGQ